MAELCRVVNLYKEPFDVYVGRGRNPRTGLYDGHWGNPFVIGQVRFGVQIDREMACWLYEDWITGEDEGAQILRQGIKDLCGLRLGCYCKMPDREVMCHGDTLARLANEYAKTTR